MCGWPPSCKGFRAVLDVACGHVSGLWCGRVMTAGPDGFRGARPRHFRGLEGPLHEPGCPRSLGRPIHHHAFLPSQAQPDPNARLRRHGPEFVSRRMTAHRPQRGRSVSAGAAGAAGRGAMRAILLASATATTRRGRRASSDRSHGLASTALGQRSTAWAPMIRRRRSSASPRLLIPPRRALPPLEFCARHRARAKPRIPARCGRRRGWAPSPPGCWRSPARSPGSSPAAGWPGWRDARRAARRPSAASLVRELLELLDEHRQDPTRQLGHAILGLVPDRGDQLRDMARALGRDDAELGQMAAQRIDQHGPLPHQQIAGAMDGQRRLLLLAS